MAKRQSDDFRRYAVVGAEQRLTELANEAAEIFRVFPELSAHGRGLDAVRPTTPARTSGSDSDDERPNRKGGRRRSKMSAEARKRISDAQKARWAKQKAQAAASAPAPTTGRKKR
jgi:hypothetical protein